MTTDTVTPTTAGGDLEVAFESKPFLRITGTFPAPEGGVSTIALEMNVGDSESLADDFPEVDEEGSARFKSWFTDFVTCAIAALRRPPAPQAIMLTGAGAGVFLADRMRHAEDCDGSCGQALPTVRPASPDAAAQAETTGGE